MKILIQVLICSVDFFPSLHKEISEVVDFFNRRTQKLLERHLASGCKKCFIWLENKLQGNHVSMIQECNDLVTYATVNATCIRSILKKYDKIHNSRQGLDFKSRARNMHIEILQSPWFYELMAFQMNLLREPKVNSGNASSAVLKVCSLVFDDGKPFLSIELDSVKLDIELTCAICLETSFDPVSLACGHIFCYVCACKASSVSIADGLSAANPNKKCPICREEGVYEYSVHMDEVNLLLKRSCPEYWEARRKSENKERLELIKEHWRALSIAI
ncbi:E3 ubiquitin-protein ligase bah1 [Phtheirospermum japonicum]|uniref:RING-type E3 ubiquitin transferase n=1 Tax=Phtheirospermum japonicum TaxID=374723 RepID=A0A830BF55_9LAMI|nr:E3 ubiquitin-protein ligase bah1 [Phtheirospermum japonicum]